MPYGNPERELKIRTIVIIFGALLVFATTYLIIRNFRVFSTQTFEDALRNIDEKTALLEYEHVEELIDRAKSLAVSSSDWQSLAKRAFVVAPAHGTYASLRDVSNAASELFPGRAEFFQYLAYADLRAGDADGAWERLLPSDASPAAVALRKEIIQTLTLDYMGSGAELRALEQLATKTGDEWLLMYVAVAYAENKDFQKARSLLATLEKHDFTFWLDLYGRNFQRAHEYVNARTVEFPESISERDTRAELLFRVGKRQVAKESLALVLQDDGAAWQHYANYAYLLQQTGSEEAVIDALEAGIASGEDTDNLILFLASLMVERGADSRAKELLADLQKRSNQEEIAEMIEIMLSVKNRPLPATSAALWDSYGRDKNYLAARLLAAFSYQIGNLGDLSLVLRRSSAGSGMFEWHEFYSAILSAANDEYKDSELAFMDVGSGSSDWRMFYNAAVMAAAQQHPTRALDLYRQAEQMLSPGMASEVAAVRLAIARVLISQKNYEGAARQIDYASDLTPGNPEVINQLRELEAAMN